jgi:uncharacterized damage-inducible protein DinB
MDVELIRGLYDYHWWANRRLWAIVAALGEEPARRDVGKQFSFPTLKGMFAHIYGADWVWMERWHGRAARLPSDADFPTLAALRARWDVFEREQQQYIRSLTAADLTRVIRFTSLDGRVTELPLWPQLQHVANHATHHRSEIATMLTMIDGSPPSTDLIIFHRIRTGQLTA